MEEKVIAKNYPNIIPGITSVTSNSHYNSNLQRCFVNVKPHLKMILGIV